MKNLDELRCPACVKLEPSKLIHRKNLLICTNDACRYKFKLFNGMPILITNSGDTLEYYSQKQKRERKNKSTKISTKK